MSRCNYSSESVDHQIDIRAGGLSVFLNGQDLNNSLCFIGEFEQAPDFLKYGSDGREQ